MSKSLRLFLFLLFLFAFLISAPIVVLYTAGFRFDLTNGRIVHTAVLNISSEPRNADVLVDGIPASDKTPAVLETILPGEHIVGLQKEGYLPWETSLLFESREALVLGPIILFLDAQPELRQTINAAITAIHAQTNRFAYATQESSWLEVWVVDASTSQTKLLMRLPYSVTSSYALAFSTSGTYLALIETHGSRQDMTVTRVDNGTTIELPEDPRDAEEELLSFYPEHLTTSRDRLVVLSESGNRAVLSYQDGETASIITYLPLGDYVFVEAPGNLIALQDTRRGRFILLDPDNREQPILLSEEANLWRWHPSGDILLYSSGYDLKRYVRSAHETQTLTRLSTTIESIDWYPTGTTAVYRTGQETIAVWLDGGSILSQTTLVQDLNGQMWTQQDGKQMHVLRVVEGATEWWTRALQN